MVLAIFGYNDQPRQQLSDATCTALQLANFWQDVRRDYAKGRIYLPQEDMEHFGYSQGELARGEFNARFATMMRFEVDRARQLFGKGAPLVDTVQGQLKLDLKLFTLGGESVLDAIEAQGYDVLTKRPVVSKLRKAQLTATGLFQLVSEQLPWPFRRSGRRIDV